jgi:hypothetical protein
MSSERRRGQRCVRRLPVEVDQLQLFTTNFSQSGIQVAFPVLWLTQLEKKIEAKSLAM